MTLIELNGERQLVETLDGYDDWTVIADGLPPQPDEEAVFIDGQWIVPLDVLKARVWAAVKAKRTEVENGVASTPAGGVQCDDASKIKISGLVTMAMLALQQQQSFAIDFTMADNSNVTLDAPTAIAMGTAVGQFVAAAHDRAQALRAAIYAASSAGELAAIDIESGWPG